MLPVSVCRCMTTWLPRRRTSVKPCCSRIRHTSRPERTRSLPMPGFDPRYEYFGPQTTLDLYRVRALQEELDRFAKVGSGFLDGRPSTGDVKLGAQCRIDLAILLDDRRVHRRRHFRPLEVIRPTRSKG